MLECCTLYSSPRSGAMLVLVKAPTRECGDLTIERVLAPGMGFLLPHVHLDFDEVFRVAEGVGDGWIGRQRIRLGKGDEFVVTRHDTHTNPCNRSNRDLVIQQTFRPGTRAAERYVDALGGCLQQGRDVRGDLPTITAMSLLAVRDPQTYVPALSQRVQRRVMFPVARSIQRWRDDRRVLKEEEKAAAAASEYGFWAEDGSTKRVVGPIN